MNTNQFNLLSRGMAVAAVVLNAGLGAGCAFSPANAAGNDGAPGTVAAGQPKSGKVMRHTAPLRFVRFADPMENAFSAEIPEGWQASGGVNRQSSIETRPALDAVSPEGIRISMGAPTTPTFIVPNYMLNSTGFPEGSRYPSTYGGYMQVQRYLPGVRFAGAYAQAVAEQAGCGNFQFRDGRERPDLSENINGLLSRMAAYVRVTSGEVAFECTSANGTWRGSYVASTLYSEGSNGLAIWAVYSLHGFLAPEGRAGVAQAALRHMVASHAVNPQWAAMQGSMTRNVAAITAQSNEQISRIITDGYWSRQATLNEVWRRDANARRGTTDVANPETGESWNMAGNHEYWWIRPGSDVPFGTDSPNPPEMGAIPLVQY
jgi:hypothetical protein